MIRHLLYFENIINVYIFISLNIKSKDKKNMSDIKAWYKVLTEDFTHISTSIIHLCNPTVRNLTMPIVSIFPKPFRFV